MSLGGSILRVSRRGDYQGEAPREAGEDELDNYSIQSVYESGGGIRDVLAQGQCGEMVQGLQNLTLAQICTISGMTCP